MVIEKGALMKEFRWTAVVGLVVLAVWGGSRLLEDGAHPEADGAYVASEAEALFRFEKEEVVRVEIRRPQDTLVLSDTSEGWRVEPGDFPASRSMVSRIKHQLHDLDARARVVEDADAPALYGLGEQAIEVSVSMRNGEVVRFAAGDPNPTSVSFYIRPLPGDVVYTVKKSAVDFYSFDAASFREPRFATLSSRDAVRLEADLPEGKRWVMQKVGEDRWELLEPMALDMETDRARGLLGRLGALKAREFVQEVEENNSEDLALYGLLEPRARFVVSFGAREPMEIHVGRGFDHEDDSTLAYMKIAGESTVYLAKEQLLNDFLGDPLAVRNRTFISMSPDEVRRIEIALAPHDGADFSGEVSIRLDSDVWKWEDGRPVPGSTPRRLAERIAQLRANDFVDDPSERRKANFEDPIARVVLSSEEDSVTLRIGQKGPPIPAVEGPGEERPAVDRYYAKVESDEEVYLVDPGVLGVIEDAVREHQRKETKDQEQEERRDLMREEFAAP